MVLIGCGGSVGTTDQGNGDDDPSNGGSGGSTNEGGHGGAVDVDRLRIRNEGLELTCDKQRVGRVAPMRMARLTNRQYTNTLRDSFPGVDLGDLALPPETQFDGYRNNVEAQAPSEPYVDAIERIADRVAPKVVDVALGGCAPKAAAEEAACIDKLVDGFAGRLFRRPVTDDERTRMRAFFADERKMDDFRTATTTLVSGLLQSPQFLYRPELGTGQAKDGKLRLTGHEIAARLSYLFWDTAPDAGLREAAEKGTLDRPDGIAGELERLLADGRAKSALGEMLQQWFDLGRLDERLAATNKSRALFAKYDAKAAQSAADGTRRYLDWVLWDRKGSVRDLFAAPKAFADASTAWLYGVTPPGAGMQLVDTDANRRIGLLGQAGVMAGLGHETLPASILRGVYVLDRVLCRKVPPPPDGIDTSGIKADAGDDLTNRQRTQKFHDGGTCKACHQIIDSVGFTLEHYDAVGAWQDQDNGKAVDASGGISGTFDADGAINGPVELSRKLAASEQVAECAVVHLYQYALARSLHQDDACTIADLTNRMVGAEGWPMRDVFVDLARSDVFRFKGIER